MECAKHHEKYPQGEICPKCKATRDRQMQERNLSRIESRITLRKLSDTIEKLNINIEALNNILQTRSTAIRPIFEYRFPDGPDLAKLPDHIRKTAMILLDGKAITAEEVSKITNRARAVESMYLNQLVNLGYCTKRRIGRKALFEAKVE